MDAIVQFLMNHGYAILFGVVFARQIGLPVPAPLFLLAAGALAAAGKLRLAAALGLAIAACVLADWVWYEAGRRWGDRVLQFIYRFAPDPGAVDRNARKAFARFGPPILVLDKFVPGLDAVVPPLAGSCHTGRWRFLAFESIGAALWVSAYAGLGYVLCEDMDRAVGYVSRTGTLFAGTAVAALAIYAIHNRVQRSRPKVASVRCPDPQPFGRRRP